MAAALLRAHPCGTAHAHEYLPCRRAPTRVALRCGQRCCASDNDPVTDTQATECFSQQEAPAEVAPQPRRMSDLLDEVLQGTLLSKCQAVPAVPWGPVQLAQVLGVGMMVLLGGIAYPVLAPGLGWQSSTAALNTLGLGGLGAIQQDAWLHLLRETLLLAGACTVLGIILGKSSPRSKGLFRYDLPSPWLATTLTACAVAFPLADPVITDTWVALLGGEELVAGTAGSALAEQVVACVTEAEWGALGLHVLASGGIGPLWEETFWRGFFLTSLTKVLPPPACIAASSLVFALLHLTPTNLPAIWLLAALSDVLYLRSGTLGAPLLLHAAWNTSQLLAVAFLGKETFV